MKNMLQAGGTDEAVIGVDTGDPAAPVAHALSARLGRHAVAPCGFPADYLQIAPGLTWYQIAPERRCRHCEHDLGEPFAGLA